MVSVRIITAMSIVMTVAVPVIHTDIIIDFNVPAVVDIDVYIRVAAFHVSAVRRVFGPYVFTARCSWIIAAAISARPFLRTTGIP